MPLTTCFLCGSDNHRKWATAKDVEYHSVPESYPFYECLNCRLLQIDPVPSDKLSVIYPSNYYSFASQKKSVVNDIKEWLDKRLFGKILNRLTGEINVLDVGGGSGWLLNVIKSISSRVGLTQVVDIDPGAKEVAEKNGHEYFHGTIESFTSEKKFDFVLLLNLIEHVADPLAVLQKIEQVLTNQGVVLIKTPNYDSLDSRIFRQHNWGGLHCPRHWVIFSEKSFRLVADKAGLKIDSLNYTQGAPFWAISILAWLNDKKIITVNKERPAYTHPLYTVFIGLFAGFDILRKPFGKTSQMFIVLSKK